MVYHDVRKHDPDKTLIKFLDMMYTHDAIHHDVTSILFHDMMYTHEMVNHDERKHQPCDCAVKFCRRSDERVRPSAIIPVTP